MYCYSPQATFQVPTWKTPGKCVPLLPTTNNNNNDNNNNRSRGSLFSHFIHIYIHMIGTCFVNLPLTVRHPSSNCSGARRGLGLTRYAQLPHRVAQRRRRGLELPTSVRGGPSSQFPRATYCAIPAPNVCSETLRDVTRLLGDVPKSVILSNFANN